MRSLFTQKKLNEIKNILKNNINILSAYVHYMFDYNQLNINIPNIDINITYSGLRPGEKLYEELLNDAENTTQTYHEKILIAQVREVSFELVKQNTLELEIILSTTNDEMLLVGKMKELVPEYISNNSIYQQLDTKVISISN